MVFVRHGFYLDENTSLFETLDQIIAAEASIPVGGKCATLAAQVKHISFYLDIYEQYVRDPDIPKADWGEVWRTVNQVNDEEWKSIKTELRSNYNRILALIEETSFWDDEDVIGGAIDLIAHTIYHLGELRQALCCLRS
jgi:hypothetical protein